MDYTFYIPKNVSTRFELVKGIGIKELRYTGIATIIVVIIAFLKVALDAFLSVVVYIIPIALVIFLYMKFGGRE